MTQTPAETLVEFMSFSPSAHCAAARLKKLNRRQWERLLQWMHDAGLAFYFLQRLKTSEAAEPVPPWVLSQLQQHSANNGERVEAMARRLGAINQRFNDAGVRYVVLKGISLVPEFCPEPSLRYQADFDYLVDESSLPAARRVLSEAGYSAKPSASRQDFTFVPPGNENLLRRPEEYYRPDPHVVELHLDVWDSDRNRLPKLGTILSVDRARIHEWNGLSFPALADDDAFLLQVLHTCRHLFVYWIRMSCLLEVAHFLTRRATDNDLWNRIEQRVGDSTVLREFTVVTVELAAQLFSAPIPSLIRAWAQRVRPATRVWMANYARQWAFGDIPVHQFRLFPKSKLVLFLHQQYESDCAQRHIVRRRLIATSRLGRVATSVWKDPSLILNFDWWRHQFLIRHSMFHAMAGLRYLFEIPRWLWLNRTMSRSESAVLSG